MHDAVHWTFWPSLAGAAVILSLGQPLLSLFGPDFTAGYPVMFILVIGFLFRSAMGPAEYILNMLGEQTRCAQVLVGSAVLNVILNLCLVPPFGLIGAACATSASMMIAALLNYVVVRKRAGARNRDLEESLREFFLGPHSASRCGAGSCLVHTRQAGVEPDSSADGGERCWRKLQRGLSTARPKRSGNGRERFKPPRHAYIFEPRTSVQKDLNSVLGS